MIRFNKFIKNSISGVLISSVLLNNVGYCSKHEKNQDENKSSFAEKALNATIAIGIPAAIFFTWWWLSSGSSDNEQENIEQQKSMETITRKQQIINTNPYEKPVPQNQTENIHEKFEPQSKEKQIQKIHKSEINKEDIDTIIEKSYKIFDTKHNRNAGKRDDIINSYQKNVYLGEIVARYFSLAGWTTLENIENFENGVMSQWFIGAIKEYFIGGIYDSKETITKNINLIKTELIDLYNEKDAQKIVEISRRIVLKIILNDISTNYRNLVTPELINYQLQQGILVGSDDYFNKLKKLKAICEANGCFKALLDCWYNLREYGHTNINYWENIFREIFELYGYTVQTTSNDEYEDGYDDFEKNLKPFEVLNDNWDNIENKIDIIDGISDVAKEVLKFCAKHVKYRKHNQTFSQYVLRDVRPHLINVIKEIYNNRLFEEFNELQNWEGKETYLKHFAESIVVDAFVYNR